MRKPDFCICENKDADQLRGNREADQRLCFRYIDSTIPLLPKSEISRIHPSSVVVQPGLCRIWSETRRPVFSQRGSNDNGTQTVFYLLGGLQRYLWDHGAKHVTTPGNLRPW